MDIESSGDLMQPRISKRVHYQLWSVVMVKNTNVGYAAAFDAKSAEPSGGVGVQEAVCGYDERGEHKIALMLLTLLPLRRLFLLGLSGFPLLRMVSVLCDLVYFCQ